MRIMGKAAARVRQHPNRLTTTQPDKEIALWLTVILTNKYPPSQALSQIRE